MFTRIPSLDPCDVMHCGVLILSFLILGDSTSAAVDFKFYLLTEEQWNVGNLRNPFLNALANVSSSVCSQETSLCAGHSSIPVSKFSVTHLTSLTRFLTVTVAVQSPGSDRALVEIGRSGRLTLSSFIGGWTIVGVGSLQFSPPPDHFLNIVIISISCTITFLLIAVTWILSAVNAKKQLHELALARRASVAPVRPVLMGNGFEASGHSVTDSATAQSMSEMTTDATTTTSPCRNFLMAPMSGGGSCAVALPAPPSKPPLLLPLAVAPLPETSAAVPSERLPPDFGQRQTDILQQLPQPPPEPPAPFNRTVSALDVLTPSFRSGAPRLPPMALRTLQEESPIKVEKELPAPVCSDEHPL